VLEPLTELIEALTRAGIVKGLDMNARAPIKAPLPSAIFTFAITSRRHQLSAGGALNFALFSAQLTPHPTIAALNQETMMSAIRACCRAFSCALRAAAYIRIDRQNAG
jgi:hypothetical protein